MIKFQNEEMMKKWAAGLDQQRKENTVPTQPGPRPTSAKLRLDSVPEHRT